MPPPKSKPPAHPVTNFQNISTSHKTNRNPGIPPLASQPRFPTPSDNEGDEKLAGFRANHPLSATQFRPLPAIFSVCNKLLRKTGNAFPKRFHGLAKASRSRLLGRTPEGLRQRLQRLLRRPRPMPQAGPRLPHARRPRLHLGRVLHPPRRHQPPSRR